MAQHQNWRTSSGYAWASYLFWTGAVVLTLLACVLAPPLFLFRAVRERLRRERERTWQSRAAAWQSS